MPTSQRCLVTGASGYIGGRLVPELLAAGYGVRCMARDPGKLDGRPWSGDVEVAAADAMDPAAVRRALDGIEVAYYLIHSLGTGPTFEQKDRQAAGNLRPEPPPRPGSSASCTWAASFPAR